MASARRALGELLAAIIVAVALTTAAVATVAAFSKAAQAAHRATEAAAERLSDAANPPLLGVERAGNSLYLVVYAEKPVKVKYVVYVKGSSLEVREVNKTIINVTRMLLDENYDCTPARVVLVTDSGVAVPYTPARDPGVLAAVYAGYTGLLGKTRIDCELLDAIEKARGASSSPTEAGVVASPDMSAIYRVVSGDPAEPALVRGDPYTIDALDINITGLIASAGVNLSYSVILANNGQYIGNATLYIGFLSGDRVARAYIGSVQGDQGQEVRIYAVASCASTITGKPQRACVAGILFDAGEPTVYQGEVSIRMKSSATLDGTECPLSSYSYLAPAMLGQLSLYGINVSARCSVYYSLGKTYIEVPETWTRGVYATTGPLVLVYSSGAPENVEVRAEVWLRSTNPIRASRNSSVDLPCSGPVRYSLVPVDVKPASALEAAIMQLYSYHRASPVLEVVYNGTITPRMVGTSPGFIPLEGASYRLVAPAYDTLPFAARLSVAYSSRTLVKDQYHEIKVMWWNITGTYGIQPFMLPLPYIVKVSCVEDGTELLIALPPTDPPRISQGPTTYQGLAPLICCYDARVEAPNQSLIYLVAASGSPDTGLELGFNLSSPLRAVTMPGGRLYISEPGTYVVVAAPQEPVEDPAAYGATVVRAY